MKKLVIIIILILLIFFWAPWITDEYAKNLVKHGESYAHLSLGQSKELRTAWYPFGRNVITGYGSVYYVNCLGFTLSNLPN